jgi:hypothetical protein
MVVVAMPDLTEVTAMVTAMMASMMTAVMTYMVTSMVTVVTVVTMMTTMRRRGRRRGPPMFLCLVFNQVSEYSPANRTQKAMLFLVSEVIARGSTSKRSSKTTVTLEIFPIPVQISALFIMGSVTICIRDVNRRWLRIV